MKKIISALLAIALVLLLIPFETLDIYAVGIEETEIVGENKNNYNKIHFYFDKEEHATVDDPEELTVAVESLKTVNSDASINSNGDSAIAEDEIQVTIEFESDFMNTAVFKALSTQIDSLTTSDEVLEFRKALNAFSEKYHSAIIKQNMGTLSEIDYTSLEEIKFSPFVVLKMNPEDLTSENLETLCDSASIENISLSYELVSDSDEDPDASWGNVLAAVEAQEIVTTNQYAGAGIRIGVYESGGICDVNHTNLAGKNIVVRDPNSEISKHATSVTSIIALMAPFAVIYVSKTSGTAGFSWFIENYCDVVNCSFSTYNNVKDGDTGIYTKGVRGYRYDIDAIYDYQIRAHLITVCKSAGNKNDDNTESDFNPDAEVVSPGYACNVITVGGVNSYTSSGEVCWTHANGACYDAGDSIIKPEISAPFAVAIPNDRTFSGTSAATPIVTASVAILMGCKPSYRFRPERVKSVLMSTAQKTYDYATTQGTFDKKVGAGIISLDDAIENYQHALCSNPPGATGRIEVISREISLEAGTELQVGLSWLVTVDVENQKVYRGNYDVHLYNSSGSIVKNSDQERTNVDMFRYSVPTTGTYRLVVYQMSPMNRNVSEDRIALVYTVFGDDTGHIHCYEGTCTWNDTSTHRIMCYCGEGYIDQDHEWTSAGTNKVKCVKCMLTLTGTIPGSQIQ